MRKVNYIALILLLTSVVFAQKSDTATKIKPAPKSKIIKADELLKDIKFLSADEMKGRGAGTPESAKAREYIAEKFKKAGLKMFDKSFIQEVPLKLRGGAGGKGANVVGYIEGKKSPEKYIVITAHYDHVGTENGEIYNGADDNASGTAALFAMAEYFSKNSPSHSLIFAAFDGEETGLQGSRHFVANLPVKKESIALNINMDMIAHNDKNELYAVGTYHYPQLKPALETVRKTASVKLLFGHDNPDLGRDDWTSQSDHAAFHRAKIPFIYFGVEDHKDYHRPTDDFENINQEFYIRAVETIIAAVKSFDKDLRQIGLIDYEGKLLPSAYGE